MKKAAIATTSAIEEGVLVYSCELQVNATERPSLKDERDI